MRQVHKWLIRPMAVPETGWHPTTQAGERWREPRFEPMNGKDSFTDTAAKV